MPEPQPIGPTLDELLDQAVFGDPDPRIQQLKDEWERTKAEEQAVFERVCAEEYQYRLDYHRTCQTPDAEAVARREVELCRILFREELQERLGVRWSLILGKVSRVLEDKEADGE